MLVLVLVLGMTVVGCGGSGDGSSSTGDSSKKDDGSGSGGYFTLTNIPSKYNGGYVYLDDGIIEGVEDIVVEGWNYDESAKSGEITVSNGSAKIPMWAWVGDSDNPVRYSGSHTISFFIIICDSDGEDEYELIFDSVKFTNGNATKSWSDGKPE